MTPHRLYEVTSELSAHPDVRIVGSLARAACMGQLLDDYHPDGTPRNINVLNLVKNNWQTYGSSFQTYQGLPVSTGYDRWVRVGDDGTWLVHPNAPSTTRVKIESAAEIFAPVTHQLGSFIIQTVAPEVLGKLYTLMGASRPKDITGQKVFAAYLATIRPTIDPDLLQPFEEFGHLVTTRHSMPIRNRARSFYQRIVPGEVRGKLRISTRLPAVGLFPPMEQKPYYVPAPTVETEPLVDDEAEDIHRVAQCLGSRALRQCMLLATPAALRLTGPDYVTSDLKRQIDVVIASSLLPLSRYGMSQMKKTFADPIIVQERVGAGGKRIAIPKLQTLGKDGQPATAMAAMFRRIGLDEAPQCRTILAGEMHALNTRRPLLPDDEERILATALPCLSNRWQDVVLPHRPSVLTVDSLRGHIAPQHYDDPYIATDKLRRDIRGIKGASLANDIRLLAAYFGKLIGHQLRDPRTIDGRRH